MADKLPRDSISPLEAASYLGTAVALAAKPRRAPGFRAIQSSRRPSPAMAT
jgi:hypothetical protein